MLMNSEANVEVHQSPSLLFSQQGATSVIGLCRNQCEKDSTVHLICSRNKHFSSELMISTICEYSMMFVRKIMVPFRGKWKITHSMFYGRNLVFERPLLSLSSHGSQSPVSKDQHCNGQFPKVQDFKTAVQKVMGDVRVTTSIFYIQFVHLTEF